MNYISLDNLTRYHSKFKDYADTKYTLASDYGWKQTEKAGAVTCWPVGESRMKPVVEFLFKETLPVGDKSSQNPSTITGVSSIKVTRCGKNLCPNLVAASRNGITCTDNGNGSYTVSGIAAVDTGFAIPESFVLHPETYILSGCPAGGGNSTYMLAGLNGRYDTGNGKLFTVSSTPQIFSIWIQTFSGVDLSTPITFYPQLEFGSSITSFEKPEYNNYNISFGSTFYGGILDVSTGKLTVTHRMIEADSLTLDISNYPAYLPLECTDTFGRTITSTGNILALTGSTGGKIVYKLANPYTVQIDSVAITSLPQIDKYTPRLNTLYTNAENIAVKYIKSPIRDEYEKVQAIIANGGTI